MNVNSLRINRLIKATRSVIRGLVGYHALGRLTEARAFLARSEVSACGKMETRFSDRREKAGRTM